MNASHSVPRVDAAAKGAATAEYVADLDFAGMLYARTLRADRPRARILSVDVPPLPEGYCTVDCSDVPGKNRIKMLVDDWPFFADGIVNHIGEPILLVVGPDREVLDALLAQIAVHYEDLPPILSVEDAHSGSMPPLYGDDNCFAQYEVVKGDLDGAFAGAARIVESEHRTGYQEHVYIEPQGFVGLTEPDGKIAVHGSMQCPYYVKNALIQGLGCAPEKVRVVQTTTGGAFGGKEEYPSLIAGHVAFAALKTGKPVQLLFDRGEDIVASTKRHPSVFRYRTALDAGGHIRAMDVEIELDGGAYAGLSSVVLQRAIFAATGIYRVDNLRVSGQVLATNTVPTGAFRGFGAPQAFFAIEMHMERIAAELGVDPLELKMSHALHQGDETSTGGHIAQTVKLPEMVEQLERMSGYTRKRAEIARRPCEGIQPRRGIGLSLFFHGCGFTGNAEQAIIKGRATLVKLPGGKAEILVSSTEMGQGAQTTLRKIVARTLDIPLGNVLYANPDTDRVPDSGPTVASRTVMVVGRLLERAAEEMRTRWDSEETFSVTTDYRQPAWVQWDQDALRGDAYPTYSWGANVVEVEVDPLTLEIAVCGAWGVYDIGAPIDERIVQGQIEGGVVQGLGYATIEVMNTKAGRILQSSLTDYIVPTVKDVPPIESRLVANPYEDGPFGAKGAGELPLVGAAPALAAAVRHALGLPVANIPVTPEYLLQLMERERSGQLDRGARGDRKRRGTT